MYGVFKGQSFIQTNDLVPVLKTGTPFRFSAFVDLSDSGLVTSADVRLPGGASRALEAESKSLGFEEDFASQSALD